MCAQRRLESVIKAAHSDRSLRCPHEESFASFATQNLPSEDRNEQADLNLWLSERTFSDVVAHLITWFYNTQQ